MGHNSKCCSSDIPSSFETLIGLNYNVDFNNVNYETHNSNVAYSNLLNSTFVPTNVFIISYDKVVDSNNSLNSMASFQIFLLTDSSSSIVIFKYRLCPKDWFLVVSSGLIYNNGGKYSELKIPKGEECSSSNVNQTGVWMIEVTSYALGKFLIELFSNK